MAGLAALFTTLVKPLHAADKAGLHRMTQSRQPAGWCVMHFYRKFAHTFPALGLTVVFLQYFDCMLAMTCAWAHASAICVL